MRTLVSGLAVVVITNNHARAQGTVVDSFSDIPYAVFYDIDNPSPCGVHYRDSIPIDTGAGHIVTASYYSEFTIDHRFPSGCINYTPSTWDSFRITPDPMVDPGDFDGDYANPSPTTGDLIINFSEPLTAFGSTSILGPFATSLTPNDRDRIQVFDAPNGEGALLADFYTADIIHLKLFLDFKGVHFPAPVIRSARIVAEGPSFSTVGFAISVGPIEPPCPPDLNADGVVDNGDIGAFITLFLAQDPAADFTVDGIIDNGDIGAFVNAFLAGC
ncbi:MAG: GC-type dockerin domain-anchored protein [Phycisphaerales bacterium JB040]